MMDAELERLMKKYSAAELVRLTGGFTNAVYLLKGIEPPLVAKVAQWSNRDLQNEANSLLFLKNTPFTPKLIDIFSENQVQIIVYTFVKGMNGQAVLDTGDLKRSTDLFRDMGKLLSTHIHSYSYTGDHGGLRSADFKTLRFDLDYVPKVLIEKSQVLLRKIEAPVHEWTLTHGDYGAHNILANGGNLTVIDWEWAEWSHPFVDIAWTCWNTKLHYPKIADGLNRTFIQAYQTHRPISRTSEQIQVYSLYKLWTILQKIQHADRETQMKWINRLEWTLHTDIL